MHSLTPFHLHSLLKRAQKRNLHTQVRVLMPLVHKEFLTDNEVMLVERAEHQLNQEPTDNVRSIAEYRERRRYLHAS